MSLFLVSHLQRQDEDAASLSLDLESVVISVDLLVVMVPLDRWPREGRPVALKLHLLSRAGVFQRLQPLCELWGCNCETECACSAWVHPVKDGSVY